MNKPIEFWLLGNKPRKARKIQEWDKWPGDEAAVRVARRYLDNNGILCGVFEARGYFCLTVLSSFSGKFYKTLEEAKRELDMIYLFDVQKPLDKAIEKSIKNLQDVIRRKPQKARPAKPA